MTASSITALLDRPLTDADPELARLVDAELARQRDQIELIASENFTSRAVLEAASAVLTNKYAEGYPGKRYYGGCEVVDDIEQLAIDRAKALFGADHANVQAHSGSQANMAAYFAVLTPGDTVLSLKLDHGGHLTHGLSANFSGKLYNFVQYGVREDNQLIDFDEVRALAREHKPKLIVAGASAYPRTIDAAAFREIADEVGAKLMVDMAHFAGLVASGHHPDVVAHADIVTSTTHKTLRGPRSGLILCREELATQIDRAVFPGMQGGPLCHVVAAKAACFQQAASDEFRQYCGHIVANATAMADEFTSSGWSLVSGGTDTHLLLADLRAIGWTGLDAEHQLDKVHITVNRNGVPFDDKPPTVTSGIRIGTPAVTSRGFSEEDCRETARIIMAALSEDADLDALAARADTLLTSRPLYPSFSEGHV